MRGVVEMKMTLAAVYSSFKTEVVDDTGIEMDDRYVAPLLLPGVLERN